MKEVDIMVHNTTMIAQLKTVDDILHLVGVTKYALGGSLAFFLRGVMLPRKCKDYDILVDRKTWNLIQNNPNFKVLFEEADLEYDGWVEHKIFKTSHIEIDIVYNKYLSPLFDREELYSKELINGIQIYVPSLEVLIRSKKLYNRTKDQEDLKSI